MRKLIKKILKMTGLYPLLVFIRPPVKKPALLKTTGLSIEFIGPAGVGKSTLFEAIKNHTAGEWYYREKLRGLKLKEREDMLDGGLHWKLLFAKALNLDERMLNGFRKTKLMRYFTEVVQYDLYLNNGVSDRGFLLEEGLCHNFPKELNELSDDQLRTIMFGRALVYLKPKHSSTVVKRIRKRAHEGGHMVTHHIGLSDDELIKIAETSMNYYNLLINRALAIGVPICTVFAEDDINQNAVILLDFEKNLLLKTQ